MMHTGPRQMRLHIQCFFEMSAAARRAVATCGS
jgi:hypothetical protein